MVLNIQVNSEVGKLYFKKEEEGKVELVKDGFSVGKIKIDDLKRIVEILTVGGN